MRCGFLTLDPDRLLATVAGRRVELTPMQAKVLERLMLEPRVSVSQVQLLEAIWGPGEFRPSRTVSVHVHHLRRKLYDYDGLIVTHRPLGYRLDVCEWEPDGVGIVCGCGRETRHVDVCACGRTRERQVLEAGPLPRAVVERREAAQHSAGERRAREMQP